MTTKKHSLLDRKVLKKVIEKHFFIFLSISVLFIIIFQDLQDPVQLLSSKNLNMKNLLEYIRDACDFCTDYQVPIQPLTIKGLPWLSSHRHLTDCGFNPSQASNFSNQDCKKVYTASLEIALW